MVKWCLSVCCVKDDVPLLILPRQSPLLKRCMDFRYNTAARADKYQCSHLYSPLSLSLLFFPLSLLPSPFPHLKNYTLHTQGKNLEGCYLLLRYPENPMLAPSSSSSSSSSSGFGSSAKKHGPVNGNECYYWRTSGCAFGAKCRFRHIPGNRGIDLKKKNNY